ncbi:MAG: PAQR family membrane homeostasis protein TrhA [Oscillospiraceae bacterium]
MFKKAREPINSLTHFIGVIFSVFSIFYFAISSVIINTSPVLIFSSIIFSISMFLLYTSSTIYHYVDKGDLVIKRLKKLDHSMIYILIVGSYTPFIVKYINTSKGYLFLIILWCIAILGILMKMFWINCPRILSTSIYIILGWALVFDINSFSNINTNCLWLIAIGGISYTIGGFIYAFKKPNIFKNFGFHEVFHIFVLIGSFFHFLAIAIFVI